MISILGARRSSAQMRCARFGVALILGITAALLLFDFLEMPASPSLPSTEICKAAWTEPSAHYKPTDVVSWSRHLAAGGALVLALASGEDATAEHGAASSVVAPAEDPLAAETLLALESLGPLSLEEKAVLYEDELRRLAEARQAQVELSSAGPMDARAHCELLELHNDELRMLATLELLDGDEYWVFADDSPAPQVLAPLIGRYGLRPLMREGRLVQIMFPYASDRFPLLAHLVPARRQAEEAATSALLQEFNGLPEGRRALYRDLVAHPDAITAAEAPFVQRYLWPTLAFDPQALTMFVP